MIKKSLLQFTLLALLSLPASAFTQQQKPFTKGEDVIEHPLVQAPLVNTIDLSQPAQDWFPQIQNTWVAPAPQIDISKQQFKQEKEKANRECDEAEKTKGSQTTSAANKTQSATTPILGQSFFGNSISGTPNDNGIAVDIAGKVVSVVNTSVCMYRSSSGTPVLNNRSLAAFVSIPGNSFVFDPRVVYDPNANRFVLVFLKGNTVGDSWIHVAFSATDDPFGTWNVYQINATVGNHWTDYPQIAVNNDELFITGNMADDAVGGVVSGTIWQVDKLAGYAGNASISVRSFSVPEVGWHPVQGAMHLYGPEMYFIRTVNSPIGTTTGVFLRKINATIANNGTLSSSNTFNSTLGYSMPSDATQKGSSVKLMTNATSVQSSYYENGKIQFVMNNKVNSKPGIYYGTVQISPIDLNFSIVTGQAIGIDSFHLGYPSLAYAGQDGSGNNRSVIGFNFASANHYPSNGCVYVDETGSVSAPLVCKNGFASMDANMGASTRWGDYGGAAERTNNPGEVWLGLSIGMNNSTTNGCWISQIYAAGSQAIATDPEVNADTKMTVFPNPAPEMVNFEFELREPAVLDAFIYDMQGREAAHFGSRRLKAGGGRFTFNVQPLANGTYTAVIRGDKGEVYSRKFEVQH